MSKKTIAAPAAARRQRAPMERRAWIRYPCDLESFCQPMQTRNAKVVCSVRVCDISNNGISLLAGTEFAVGSFLSVEMIRVSQELSQPVLARVVHTTPQADGDWLLGCELTSKLSNNELRDLLT